VQEWLDYVFQLKYNGVDQAYKRLKKKRARSLGVFPLKEERVFKANTLFPTTMPGGSSN
jgi:hypothetical protein